MPGESGYWHPRSATLQPGQNFSSVADLFPQHTFLEAVNGVAILQPHAADVVHRPQPVNDTSNAFWQWQTLARAQGDGDLLPVRETNPWREVFSAAQAYLHSSAEWIEVLRYSEQCRFEIRRQKQSVSGALTLRREISPATFERQAVGFRLRADGVCFILRPEHLASRPTVPDPMLTRFRADYFKHRLARSPELDGTVNSFQAEWLADMSLAMLAATATAQRLDLPAAQQALDCRRSEAAARVLDVIFQLRGINAQGGEEQARLRQTLLDLWRNPAVLNEILALEHVLWSPPDAQLTAWVFQRYAVTLAQAIRAAMVSMAPQVSEDDLVLDVLPRADGGYDLIVTEPSPGGLGQVETIVREIQRQPRRFLDALEFALLHCPRGQAAANLLAVAQAAAAEARTGGDLATAFAQVRAASGFSEVEAAKTDLQNALLARGFSAVRSLVVSVATKLLRPASDTTSDRLIHRLNRAWLRRSHRLGIAIPSRTFAYTCAHHPRIGPFLSDYFETIGGEPPAAPQLFAQVQQLLFDTCEDSCPECLAINIPTVTLAANPAGWQDQAREVLRAYGRVRLSAGPAERTALAQALPALCVAELDLESLRVAVSLARVEQVADTLSVVLHIPDFVYG